MEYWFQDAAGGGWIDGADARFVRATALRTPMSGGIAAFRSTADADAAAARTSGRRLSSLAELRAAVGGGS